MSDSKFIAQKNGDLYEYAAMIIKKMYIHEKWALKYTTWGIFLSMYGSKSTKYTNSSRAKM